MRLVVLAAPALLIAAPVAAQDITGSWTSTQLLLNAEKDAWAAPECIDAERWAVDCPGPRPERRTGPATSNAPATPIAPAEDQPSTAAADASFRFVPSLEQRRRNFAQFLAKSREANPAGAADIERLLSMDVIGLVGDYMGKVGLRPDDLADAVAIYVMDAWEATNGQQLEPDRERAQAVRRQMVRAILSTPEMSAADNAARQELAESMLVQTALVGSAYLTAVQQGDKAVIAAVSEATRKGAIATLGIDLRQMAMTKAGLREKGGAAGE